VKIVNHTVKCTAKPVDGRMTGPCSCGAAARAERIHVVLDGRSFMALIDRVTMRGPSGRRRLFRTREAATIAADKAIVASESHR
jgi:hypothetical protein